jgi:hypothetical protein
VRGPLAGPHADCFGVGLTGPVEPPSAPRQRPLVRWGLGACLGTEARMHLRVRSGAPGAAPGLPVVTALARRGSPASLRSAS